MPQFSLLIATVNFCLRLAWKTSRFAEGEHTPAGYVLDYKCDVCSSTAGAVSEGWSFLVTVSLGFRSGQIVQEFYVDDDADEALRSSVEADTGHEIVDVDYDDVVDGAIVWWRADDAEEDDLADVLVDALSNLDDGGLIWVLIPKPSRPGALPVSDVEDAAKTTGLNTTSAASVGADWVGIRLTARPRTR